MGLKGYRLWVTLIQRAEPHRAGILLSGVRSLRSVALQVAFERQTLKPLFHFDRL
jgi:hypothetical protein